MFATLLGVCSTSLLTNHSRPCSCTLSGSADELLGDAARKARDRRRLEGVLWIGDPIPGR